FTHIVLPSFPTRRSSDLRDIDILTDILQDTRDMIALGRITEAKVILAQTSLVMYLPSFSLPISPRKHPGLAQLILRGEIGKEKLDRKSTRLNSSHVSISY